MGRDAPRTIEFMDAVEFGAFGAIAVSAIQGLMAADELLGIGHDKEIRATIRKLLLSMAEQVNAK